MFLHVTNAFQSESTHYSCLNVKELSAPSRQEISSFKWLQLDSNPHPLSSETNTQPFSQPSQIRLGWPNGWEFVSELSGCGFESSCSHMCFTIQTLLTSEKYINLFPAKTTVFAFVSKGICKSWFFSATPWASKKSVRWTKKSFKNYSALICLTVLSAAVNMLQRCF